MCICVLFSFYFFTSRHKIMIIFFILIFRISLKPFAEMGPGNISFVSLLLLEVLRFFSALCTHTKNWNTPKPRPKAHETLKHCSWHSFFRPLLRLKCAFSYIYNIIIFGVCPEPSMSSYYTSLFFGSVRAPSAHMFVCYLFSGGDE